MITRFAKAGLLFRNLGGIVLDFEIGECHDDVTNEIILVEKKENLKIKFLKVGELVPVILVYKSLMCIKIFRKV